MSDKKFEGFDEELKDLRPEVMEKALLLAAGYQQSGLDAKTALTKAVAEAELWFLDSEG